MALRFNTPPGWPVPSESWAPHEDWMPDPSWPTPPRGWAFWTVGERGDTRPSEAPGAYGTDRGSWLASLRARAAAGSRATDGAIEPAGTAGPDEAADRPSGERSFHGLLTPAGRVEA